MGMDRVKRGRGPVMVNTVAGTVSVVSMSSVYSMMKIWRCSEDAGDVRWTKLARISEEVPIVCMDVLPRNLSNLYANVEDWIAVGDGKGNVTVVRVVAGLCTLEVGYMFTWSAGLERQLLRTYWCKSLGCNYIFTADPRGKLKMWRLNGPSHSASDIAKEMQDAILIADRNWLCSWDRVGFDRELIGPSMYFGLMGDGQPIR